MKTIILAIFTVAILNGCAIFNRDNTPALNFVEKHLVPAENPGRAISYPLTVPLGLVAVSLDMLLLHPASVADEAFDDTRKLLWDDLDWNGKYTKTLLSLAPRTAFTPLAFSLDFLGRSCLDIDTKGMTSAGQVAREEQAKKAEAVFIENRPEVLAATAAIKNDGVKGLLTLETKPVFMESTHFSRALAGLIINGKSEERMEALFKLGQLLQVGGASRAPDEARALLVAALSDCLTASDRALALKALQLLGGYRRSDNDAEAVLWQVSRGADRTLAVAAREILRR